MHYQKIFSKFQNYWFRDQNFRFLLLQPITIDAPLVFDNDESRENLREYYDLEEIDSRKIWLFLVGLFFPKRDMTHLRDKDLLTFQVGQETGVNGQWFEIWDYFESVDFCVPNFGLFREKFNISIVNWRAFSFGYDGIDAQEPWTFSERLFYILGQDLSVKRMHKKFPRNN